MCVLSGHLSTAALSKKNLSWIEFRSKTDDPKSVWAVNVKKQSMNN